MKYSDFVRLNFFQKAAVRVREFILAVPSSTVKGVKAVGRGIARCGRGIKNGVTGIVRIFKLGDIWTRLSFLIMGLGCAVRGQIVKGLLYLTAEAAFVYFLLSFGWGYLKDIVTLGTAVKEQVWDEAQQIYLYVQGDNSMLILLYSVLTILFIFAFIALYFGSLKACRRAQLTAAEGKKPASFRSDIASLMNERFHGTLLTVPTVMAIAFVILPLLFMILIAFTNFDQCHQPPGNLFTWVGFENFKNMIWNDPIKSKTFAELFKWTLIWAVAATFSNYILGMLLAIMINKKGIRFKRFWRTVFVATIAIPQFVSLLVMRSLLSDMGPVNMLLQQWGLAESTVPFLTNPIYARLTVIIVNIWVGIPFTMLITTGILMNIPKEMYESARIDGAGPIKAFMKITLPYMLFVTTPYLITQFVGNFNNFNVIYLLTQGNPLSLSYYQAGQTDLLVTWLYKLTVNFQDYNLASTIGILVFLFSAVFSLIVYNMSASVKREEEFQ